MLTRRLKSIVTAAVTGFCRLPTHLFGRVSWTPPPWWPRVGGAAAGSVRRHPNIAGAVVLFAIIAGVGGWRAWDWHQRQPQPRKVAFRIDPIPVTKLEKELHPADITLHFNDSAARLEDLSARFDKGVRPDPKLQKPLDELLQKSLGARIHLSPAAEGNWSWQNDATLVFHPKQDWPAGQKYRVALDKTLFPTHVLLDRYQAEVVTPPFTASIKSFEFYQDPRDPAVRQTVGTLEFTHRVNHADLEKHLALAMLGHSSVFKKENTAQPLTITYGLHDRVAYVRSAPLVLPEREDFMKLTLAKNLATTQGDARTKDGHEKKVRIPDLASFFKITSATGRIVRNQTGEPEQVLIVETTAEAKSEDIKKALHVFLLPKPKTEKAEIGKQPAQIGAEDEEEKPEGHDDPVEDGNPYADRTTEEDENQQSKSENSSEARWESPSEIDEALVRHAKRVKFTIIPSEHEHSTVHTFKIHVEADGQLFLRIDKGVRALGGFPLADDYAELITVPAPPAEVRFQGHGGVLALSGERKLLVASRAVPMIDFQIARVATNQINHLVSQTEGRFEHPRFLNGTFDEENIARLASERHAINFDTKFKAKYSAFDFSKHLQTPADGGSERGLFFVKARGWDSVKDRPIPGIRDGRFILITDIGMLVKKNADDSSDVFLVSIKTGEPIADGKVEVLGKNGVPLASAMTSPEGRATLPPLFKASRKKEEARHEKEPVAFVARQGEDVAFMPYDREDRALNFSRFDIDGVENVSSEQLDAFVFTERGVYRPGDDVHIGLIVKQRNWRGKLDGLPVEVEVLDARGLRAQVKKLALPSLGFAEMTFATRRNRRPATTTSTSISSTTGSATRCSATRVSA